MMRMEAAQLGAPLFAAPLLEGDAGTAQTIELIRQLVDDALRDAVINRLAIDIVRSVPAFNERDEVHAVYDWVHRNIRFTKDPTGKEVLRPARDILELRAGDCDDINAVLLPALLGSVGYLTRIVTIAASPATPEQFSHVYCEALVGGAWIPLDAARPGAVFGLAPPSAFRKRAWSLFDDSYSDVSGLGFIGDDGVTPQDINATATGIANIVRAFQGQPNLQTYAYSPQIYGQPATPAQAQDNTMLWVVGIGLVLLWAMNKS
jgi:transglutaminase-like putative cysteine protease